MTRGCILKKTRVYIVFQGVYTLPKMLEWKAFCYVLPVFSKCPAIINQHTEAPLPLVSLFHCGYFLVKSLSVLIAYCPEILREDYVRV